MPASGAADLKYLCRLIRGRSAPFAALWAGAGGAGRSRGRGRFGAPAPKRRRFGGPPTPQALPPLPMVAPAPRRARATGRAVAGLRARGFFSATRGGQRAAAAWPYGHGWGYAPAAGGGRLACRPEGGYAPPESRQTPGAELPRLGLLCRPAGALPPLPSACSPARRPLPPLAARLLRGARYLFLWAFQICGRCGAVALAPRKDLKLSHKKM